MGLSCVRVLDADVLSPEERCAIACSVADISAKSKKYRMPQRMETPSNHVRVMMCMMRGHSASEPRESVRALCYTLSQGARYKSHVLRAVTGNTNTVAGNVPPKANLGDLGGLASGLDVSTTGMVRPCPQLNPNPKPYFLCWM